MRKTLPAAGRFLIVIACASILSYVFFLIKKDTQGKDSIMSLKDVLIENDAASENPTLRVQEELAMLVDPKTGRIPEGVRLMELQAAESAPLKQNLLSNPLLANTYTFSGPSNLGGRIRGLAYDVRYNGTSNRTIFASGVSGGVFRSTDDGATWTKVSPSNVLYSVTCIAQDPRPGFQDTWYYGTGESLGNSASATSALYLGFGIYRSTDNGNTWAKILNTPFAEGTLEVFDSRFDIVTSLAVNPVNGDLYAGTLNTVMRLPFGTSSWVSELGTFGGNSTGAVDVKIGSDGIVYAALPGNGFLPTTTTSVANEGVWRRNVSGVWTRIAGGGVPAWFNVNAVGVGAPPNTRIPLERIVLAIDPNDEKNIYALYSNGLTSSCTGTPVVEVEFGKYDTTTGTWVDLSAGLPDESGCSDGNDPFAVQGGYDLVLAVKPGSPNVLFLGGTNLYRLNSADGFTTAGYTFVRAGGYANTSGYGLYAQSHPDIHAIVFQPGSPNIMLCGNDGGVQRTTDNTAATVAWTDISGGLTTYQYYYVTLDPTNGSTNYLGGAQDNGTSYRGSGTNAFTRVLSGDGVSVGISSGNTMHFAGAQRGSMYRRSPALAPDFINANLTPSSGLSANRLFVTLFHLDQDNTENLYYVDFNEIWRTTTATTATSFAANFTELTGVRTTIGAVNIRSLATSRGTYNAARSKLYFGTSDGRVFRIDDPVNVAPATAPVQINSGAGMPVGTIIDIAVNPRSSDTVVAVYSNYGVSSIWFCGNATSGTPTWTNIEGPVVQLPSIRSVEIVLTSGTAGPGAPQAPNNVEYYVGTSTGLYSANDLNGASTVWAKEGSTTIGNAVVSSLAYRPIDNRLLVGTHGSGIFEASVPFSLPVNLIYFKGAVVNGYASLQWKSDREINNKGFEIEKSYDGNSFVKIGFVSASSTGTYSFTDKIPPVANQYYRLKQVDIDGKYTYSKVVLIRYKENDIPSLLYVNNPFAGLLQLTFSKPVAESVTVDLIDINGRVVHRKVVGGSASNVLSFAIPGSVNAGNYVLRVRSMQMNESRRVVKTN
jgi:hypothetical protein